MKNWIPLILLIFLLNSCDSNESDILTMNGRWVWKSRCGGIVGCVYDTPTTRGVLKVTDSEMKSTENGIVNFEESYQINSVSFQNGSKLYEVEFNSGAIWMVTVSANRLITAEYGGVIVSEYKRF